LKHQVAVATVVESLVVMYDIGLGLCPCLFLVPCQEMGSIRIAQVVVVLKRMKRTRGQKGEVR